MSKTFIALLMVLSFVAGAQVQTPDKNQTTGEEPRKHDVTKAYVLDKIEKAVDPDGVAKNCKTMIVELEMSIPMQQVKMETTAKYKFPEKSKITMNIPGMPVIKEVLNGEKAWNETEGLGIQIKEGTQLAFAKFDCKKSNPALTTDQVYKKVVLDPYIYQVGEFSCYKLICYPPDDLKIPASQIFVDDKNFLCRKMVENQLTDMGLIPVSITPSDYKITQGINTPMALEMNMLGIKMFARVLSLKINIEISDSEFEFPEKK
jgi:hypothetical protein